MTKLDKAFYQRDTLTVARELLGCRIVHIRDNKRLELRITETEAYCGVNDKGCHTYGNKKTERTRAMYMHGGIAYVYLIYGMYSCLNAVTELDEPCAVLIRGGEAVGDVDALSLMRYNKPYGELSSYQRKNLANGPGKLCLALGIGKSNNMTDLTGNTLFIERDIVPREIKTGKRINIDYAEEAKDFLWRFYYDR